MLLKQNKALFFRCIFALQSLRKLRYSEIQKLKILKV